MILHVDYDTVYVVEHGTKSRTDDYFYCSNHIKSKLNGPIYCLSTRIKAAMPSTIEI